MSLKWAVVLLCTALATVGLFRFLNAKVGEYNVFQQLQDEKREAEMVLRTEQIRKMADAPYRLDALEKRVAQLEERLAEK